MLPLELLDLPNLRKLDISGNPLESIPDVVSQIQHLEELILIRAELTEIPDAIGNLANLTQLDLSSNQITQIPDAISNLANLTQLYLSSNQITQIPDAIGNLANLTQLYLSSNQITQIPDAISNLAKLKYLDLRGNPISIPRDLLAPPARDPRPSARPILDYYFRIQDPKESTQIYEAKILIVGEGGSGKTSLANKLIDADYELKPEAEDISTQGIDILQWEFTGRNQQAYKVNIWDFGGQEIYHQTHQFFLTERSLYLLVADSRKEDTDHYFWLQLIVIAQPSKINKKWPSKSWFHLYFSSILVDYHLFNENSVI